MKLALIGGKVKPGKFASLAQTFGSSVGLVWDPDGRSGELAASIGAQAASTFEEVLASDVAGLIIVTENIYRAELVLKGCAAGKHIFVEKPMCLSVSDAVKIRDAVLANEIKFFMSDPFVGATAMHAKKVIESGLLGPVTGAEIIYMAGESFDPSESHARHLKEFSGGGIMSDIGGHVLHILYYLFGKPDSVEADFKYYTEINRELGIDDEAFITAHYPGFDVKLRTGTYGDINENITRITCQGGAIEDRGSAFHNLDIKVNGKQVPGEEMRAPMRHIQYWLHMIEDDISIEEFEKDPLGNCGVSVNTALELITLREAIYASAERRK